ncbi:ArsR/SmtB family transcription factor [Reinekea marinisedimentorum]|uniref:DNA-binding transcriptional ArsR family regulator n=1 Tax=Reinekea marinisedimentorum TaxID=230495 RepID=A0A4R3I5A6_9GAMM|nr:metalloregulator ArsR/SmtB family transcription factor [Reinekea marinisedimentorum]TCS41142.1 DNA-binding transcriptional ArsR family regulator [Reinekea marinisedimentorum]
MEIDQAAKCLAELGHTTRLQVFRLLVKAGSAGVPVGSIQAELDIPGSTLTHHISRLVQVGLVVQRREGRTLFCIAQYSGLNQLIEFLKDECCVNEGG